jgi:hypothetical protein
MTIFDYIRIVGLMGWSIILNAGLLALRAWVATLLWGWFVVTTFGLPELSIWIAAGLLVSLRIFKVARNKDTDPRPGDKGWDNVLRVVDKFGESWPSEAVDEVVGIAFVLLWGFAVHQAMGWWG